MNIQAIQAKIAKGEELTDAEREFVGTWSPDGAIAAARKSADEKHAKELAAAQVARDEAIAAMESKQNEGATEAERLKLQLDKANKKAEAAEKRIAEQAEAVAKAQRNAQIDAIAAGIQWADPASAKAGRVLIERDLVDVADLANAAEITPIIDAAKATTLTRLIAAEPTSGAGVHSSTGNAGARGGKEPILFSPDMFKGKTPEERKKLLADMASQPDPELQKVAVGQRTVMRATV